jgi:hypothetical protein
MGHVSALEPTIEAGVIWSQRTSVSAKSLLSGKAGSSAEGCVAAPDPSWMAKGSRASGHVASLEPS